MRCPCPDMMNLWYFEKDKTIKRLSARNYLLCSWLSTQLLWTLTAWQLQRIQKVARKLLFYNLWLSYWLYNSTQYNNILNNNESIPFHWKIISIWCSLFVLKFPALDSINWFSAHWDNISKYWIIDQGQIRINNRSLLSIQIDLCLEYAGNPAFQSTLTEYQVMNPS